MGDVYAYNNSSCAECAEYTCPASSFVPAAAAKGDEVLFMLPNGADAAPGAQGWKRMKVCPQPDGSKGVVDFEGTAEPGCVTAQALCCGGSEEQCMVEADNYGMSKIGSITVPCGVNVSYSYDGQCDFNQSPSYQVVGSGVPKVLNCYTDSKVACPYSFKFSLAPGYKCENGSVVTEGTNQKPCQNGGSTLSFASEGSTAVATFGLSKRDLLIAVAVAAAVAIVVAYVAFHKKPNSVLSVNQIVAQAGIDEHLVVPR